jgi:hypothetical protein
MASTACLICKISTISGCSKIKKYSSSKGHTTKLEQSISLDIYELACQLNECHFLLTTGLKNLSIKEYSINHKGPFKQAEKARQANSPA